MRRPGSGLSGETATLVELLLAAALNNNRGAIDAIVEDLDLQYRYDRCGIPGRVAADVTVELVGRLGLPVATAQRAEQFEPGDVEATLTTGETVWFEVKAQTKKATYSEITQADWVRDETDLLRWLATYDLAFRARLAPWIEHLLVVPDPESYFGEFDQRTLWLSDAALLTSRAGRMRANVDVPDSLQAFLSRKYFFHMTQEGARLIRLDNIWPIRDALEGAPIDLRLKANRSTLVAVQVYAASDGIRPVFTYHVGYKGALGRHKLHYRALDTGDFVEVRSARD